MRKRHWKLRISAWLGAILLSVVVTGCASRVAVGYRVYDPYRYEYHVWDGNEGVFYNQWIIETHRPHRDYHRLRRDEQREYWMWRHRR